MKDTISVASYDGGCCAPQMSAELTALERDDAVHTFAVPVFALFNSVFHRADQGSNRSGASVVVWGKD
jgi:hypothetical protein